MRGSPRGVDLGDREVKEAGGASAGGEYRLQEGPALPKNFGAGHLVGGGVEAVLAERLEDQWHVAGRAEVGARAMGKEDGQGVGVARARGGRGGELGGSAGAQERGHGEGANGFHGHAVALGEKKVVEKALPCGWGKVGGEAGEDRVAGRLVGGVSEGPVQRRAKVPGIEKTAGGGVGGASVGGARWGVRTKMSRLARQGDVAGPVALDGA